jgi:glycerophosphoryl diester phosphodiesterase
VIRSHLHALFILATLALARCLAGVEIIAHRGASHDAPENTLPAMQLAWEQGADAIELDLWLSADGRLIVFHDKETKRFEPKDAPSRNITSLTLAEARQLDVGAWKGPAFAGTRIPDLEAILATVTAGRRVVLELKDGPRIVPEFARVLATAGLPAERMRVISFQADTLRASKHALPQVEHYFLHGYARDKKTGAFPELATVIAQAQAAGADGLNLNHEWPVSREFAAQVAAAKLKLLVWTVNDPAIARRWIDAGAVAVTTDRPGWLRAQLGLPASPR